MSGLFWKVRALKEQGRQRNALANALRESYEPGDPGFDPNISPETAEYDPGAAFQEEAGMGATQGGPNVRNALNMLYQGEGGQPVQAFQLEQALMQQQKSKLPAAGIQYYDRWKQIGETEGPEAQKKYEDIIRNNYALQNIGGVQTLVRRGSQPQLTPLSTLGQEAGAKRELAASQGEGTALGAARTELADIEASLPRLENVVKELSELGKKATYTQAGQLTDIARRQSGMEPRESAIARREYIAKVDNEVLPLLRQTFGAAFTEREGQSLKATLGDVDASPEEKEAVLRSFINSKRAQVEVKRRRTGQSGAQRQVEDKLGGVNASGIKFMGFE